MLPPWQYLVPLIAVLSRPPDDHRVSDQVKYDTCCNAYATSQKPTWQYLGLLLVLPISRIWACLNHMHMFNEALDPPSVVDV